MFGRLAVVASLTSAVIAMVACSGGGASPEDECEDFLQLTQECYARGGRTVATNSAACGDPNVVTPQQRGQISCSLQYRETYCKVIAATVSRDTSAINPRDPEVVKLNACTAASTLTGACKEAVLAMADCGVAYGFGTCEGASLALATCVIANKAGACSLYKPDRTSTTLTPEEQAFQKCQLDAQRSALDAGAR
jgi:hypothetical protein